MGNDSALGDCQSQAKAGAICGFSVNEWLKECFQHLARRSGAAVQYLYLIEITRVLQSDFDATISW